MKKIFIDPKKTSFSIAGGPCIYSSLWCDQMGYLYEKVANPVLEWMCVGIF